MLIFQGVHTHVAIMNKMRGKTCFSCELERANDSNGPMVFWHWKRAAFLQFVEDITISATDFNTRSHAFNLVVDQYVVGLPPPLL